jgi:hypothetical protein
VVFGDETATTTQTETKTQTENAGERSSKLSEPEAALVRYSRSTAVAGLLPMSEDVLCDAAAMECHGERPIWGS